MKYHYEGVNTLTQKMEAGEIDAASEIEALRTLQSRRLEVLKLAQITEAGKQNKRVTVKDLVLPLQELATLTASGVVLVDAVNALSRNKEHPGLAKGFRKISSLIESGESFSSALPQSGLPFPDYVSHLAKAGELSGELAHSLKNASDQMNYDQALKNELRSALTYPLVLIGSGIVATLIIFFAVVPKFSHLLNDDKPLPTLAWAVLSAGQVANEYPLIIFGGMAVLVVILALIFSNKTIKQGMMNAALEMPVIGPWLAEQDAARWASLCSAMLSARVALVTSLKLAAQSSQFKRRRQKAMAVIQDVQSGVTLTESIERAGLLPGTSMNLIAVGDKTGQLAEMMGAVARLHDEACKRRMKQVLTLIEPLAILVVGVIIGIMILGIVLAITASTDIAI